MLLKKFNQFLPHSFPLSPFTHNPIFIETETMDEIVEPVTQSYNVTFVRVISNHRQDVLLSIMGFIESSKHIVM